jgi:hypothetical protein
MRLLFGAMNGKEIPRISGPHTFCPARSPVHRIARHGDRTHALGYPDVMLMNADPAPPDTAVFDAGSLAADLVSLAYANAGRERGAPRSRNASRPR